MSSDSGFYLGDFVLEFDEYFVYFNTTFGRLRRHCVEITHVFIGLPSSVENALLQFLSVRFVQGYVGASSQGCSRSLAVSVGAANEFTGGR